VSGIGCPSSQRCGGLGETAARKSHQDFLRLWKDADPDIPTYKQAKACAKALVTLELMLLSPARTQSEDDMERREGHHPADGWMYAVAPVLDVVKRGVRPTRTARRQIERRNRSMVIESCSKGFRLYSSVTPARGRPLPGSVLSWQLPE
jgi:hypothetical protein